MSDFQQALQFVLKHEGGYSNDSRDSGGETKFGISKAAHPEVDIANLTREHAAQIYHDVYWTPCRAQEIELQQIATKYFDCVVNMGLCQGCKILQRALNACGKLVVVDGQIGYVTIHATNSVNAEELLESMKEIASNFYRDLVARNSNKEVFLKGWLDRAQDG